MVVLLLVSAIWMQAIPVPQQCGAREIAKLARSISQPIPARYIVGGFEYIPENFQRAYADAEKSLSDADRDSLRSIPHVLITDRFEVGVRAVWGRNIGNTTGCKGIVLYAFGMHQHNPEQTDSERTEWIRQIFRHELGHFLHGWTDEYMAEKFGY
jgi:hypothetical protein